MTASAANTNRAPAKDGRAASCRFYELLVRDYPEEFRSEYGPHMAQVFRDCYRTEERSGSSQLGLLRFWLRTLLDLLQTAPQEHLENFGKGNFLMKNLRKDAIALLGCTGIIVIAFALLSYGRKHEVSSILWFGYALDALVTAGVIGNLIVFVLVKTTKLNPLRTALWTFLVVNSVPVIFLALIVGRTDPRFSPGSVLTGYVVSFLFWFGVHWIWAQSSNRTEAAT